MTVWTCRECGDENSISFTKYGRAEVPATMWGAVTLDENGQQTDPLVVDDYEIDTYDYSTPEADSDGEIHFSCSSCDAGYDGEIDNPRELVFRWPDGCTGELGNVYVQTPVPGSRYPTSEYKYPGIHHWNGEECVADHSSATRDGIDVYWHEDTDGTTWTRMEAGSDNPAPTMATQSDQDADEPAVASPGVDRLAELLREVT